MQAVVPRENNSNAGCLIYIKTPQVQEPSETSEILREASVTTVEASATLVEDSDETTQPDDTTVENPLLQGEPEKRVVRRRKPDV